MRTLIALVVFSCLSLSAPAFAQEPPLLPARSISVLDGARIPAPTQSTRPIFAAAVREGLRLGSQRTRLQESAATAQKPGKWISRHPALFGALVGAGAGAVASGTMENELFCSGGDEDCFFHGGNRLLVGAGMGAGIGALIGWLGSLR